MLGTCWKHGNHYTLLNKTRSTEGLLCQILTYVNYSLASFNFIHTRIDRELIDSVLTMVDIISCSWHLLQYIYLWMKFPFHSKECLGLKAEAVVVNLNVLKSKEYNYIKHKDASTILVAGITNIEDWGITNIEDWWVQFLLYPLLFF